MASLAGAGLVMLAPSLGHAYQLYSNNGLEVSLDTTLEYSNAFRVNSPSKSILNNANENDGDQNFQHGMVSNTFSVVPSLNVTDGNFGMRVSASAFIDTMYLQSNQNQSPLTLNNYNKNNQKFASGTVASDGRYAELLDAYAYGSHSFNSDGSNTVTLKVGRQVLMWGQSLFFAGNGIAGAMSPINVNNAVTLANPQAQQIFAPVGQAVLTWQPNNWLTLQGYYQFQWQPSLLPGSGSYFWNVDLLGGGSQRIVVVPGVYFGRGADLSPPQENGQFGVSAQFQIGNYDWGLYGLRFDAKTPQIYLLPGTGVNLATGTVGTYRVAYQRDIQVYGTSLSTTVGPVNVAGEISGRIHQDLVSNPPVMMPGMNENSNPGWAYGDTLHGQVSALYITPGLPLMPGGAAVVGEIEYNHVLTVHNKVMLQRDRTPSAVGFDIAITPTYYNVLPNTNLNIPLGFQWFPAGRSEFDTTMNPGTGTLNVGVQMVYNAVWQAGLTYQDYLGSKSLRANGSSKQPLADRGNISFYIQRTF
ncbi:hypothetical protein GCM10010909_16370 [Acidocella aquatica]|uniref:DUF1302 domain-containing protein n=2 Tax=Acidocella aquatica TaxID=1922313 RepID=A0ABQ6A6P3_9PROT|nr:hypothetical protein GCM10010909_16370 [Acidocella aquatica]